MVDVAKTPAKCSSAKFGAERAGGAFALLSCAAWLDVGLVNHQSLGIRRKDTYVFPLTGSPEGQMVQDIGERSCAMCAHCDRFSPIVVPVTTGREPQDYSDPEFSPDPIIVALGIPDTEAAHILHASGS